MEIPSYKAVIADNERDAREIIAVLLNEFFSCIEVADKADSISAATRSIHLHNPDIIFLDIEMGDGTGFDLLERLPKLDALVIFITAFDNYAIKAIKASAFDYILKPLTRDEFKQAVNKAIGRLEHQAIEKELATTAGSETGEVRRIGIPNVVGYTFVEVDSIVRCEADRSYSIVYFTKEPKTVVSKPLAYFENDLKRYGFMRVHNKHLVNLNKVVNYINGKNGGYITMIDGTQLEVSARKKPALLKVLAHGAH